MDLNSRFDGFSPQSTGMNQQGVLAGRPGMIG